VYTEDKQGRLVVMLRRKPVSYAIVLNARQREVGVFIV
jgi:hypothetical protein